MAQIKVTFINNSKVISETTVEAGTLVYRVLGNFKLSPEDTDNIVGVKINNEICSLEKRIQYTAKIEPIMLATKEGSAIYKRSLCLLLAAAAHRLYPKTRLLVGHSLGYGYYYNLDDGKEDTQEVIDAMQAEMRKIVDLDLEIKTSRIAYEEATALFDKLGLVETRKQLEFLGLP